MDISIHALCEEGDGLLGTFGPVITDFYPRPLRGGRRFQPPAPDDTPEISIHALCEEGDPGPAGKNHNKNYFYPRPLRGGRRDDNTFIQTYFQFLSTPSARRATDHRGYRHGMGRFLSTPSARRATCSGVAP